MKNIDPKNSKFDPGLLKKMVQDSTRSVVPPPGFSPLTASQADLKLFGFPMRPVPSRQPAEYAVWQDLFAASPRFEVFDANVIPSFRTGSRRVFAQLPRRQTSSNWSGAYITPRDGMVCSSIWGKFQVPTPNKPSGALGDTYRSSTWIGFDGQRRYYTSTLPQFGTAQHIDPSTSGPARSYSAWWQWWVRDDEDQAYPIVLPSPVIRAGDLIMCYMQVCDDRSGVSFVIRNFSTNHAVQFFQSAPLTSRGRPFKVPGATAEWVMERPADPPDPTPMQLPDYGTVNFHGCGAGMINVKTGARVERSLAGAKLIDMRAVEQSPERTRKISIAKPVSPTEFLTRYQ